MENRIFVEIGIFDDFAPLTASHNLADYPSGSVKKCVWRPEKASRDLQKYCTYRGWWFLMIKTNLKKSWKKQKNHHFHQFSFFELKEGKLIKMMIFHHFSKFVLIIKKHHPRYVQYFWRSREAFSGLQTYFLTLPAR